MKLLGRLLSPKGSVLVVVDVQEKLLPFIADKEMVVKNIVKLIKFAKIIGMPIVLTEQYPKGLGSTVKEIRELMADLQPITKLPFSCFGSEEFKESLRRLRASTLIIVGIETHVCVNQTALDALEKYRVHVISDATSSRTRENWRVGIERMAREGVTISSTEMLIYELLAKAGTEEFKRALELVKR